MPALEAMRNRCGRATAQHSINSHAESSRIDGAPLPRHAAIVLARDRHDQACAFPSRARLLSLLDMGLVFDGDAFGIAFYMSGDGCCVRARAARSPVRGERATVTGRNGRVL